ncbi:hypothetical protein PENSPDRAFT_646749 [Peniophora sp. CONT]|nr:hypothetical protein PENSPDRAFT_646749 [Peniophora sp. CONT]
MPQFELVMSAPAAYGRQVDGKHVGFPPGLPTNLNRDPSPDVLPGNASSRWSSSSDDEYYADRSIARTPSPTPSEKEFLGRKGAGFGFDRRNWRKYFTRAYILRWVGIAVVITLAVLSVVFLQPIVSVLKPICLEVEQMTLGFLIPIALMIALSFPPLFGAELIQVLTAFTYGPGIGFAIVAAGTILAEISVFYAFRQCWRARAEKFEQTNIKYGALASVIRQGGFFLVVLCRLSSLPPHFTTVVFTLSGVNTFVFAAGVIVSLVKVLPNILGGSMIRGLTDGEPDHTIQILNFVSLGVTFIITITTMIYIDRKVEAAKPAFVHARRKFRQTQAIHVVDGECFSIAAPQGQKAYGPSKIISAENASQESFYSGYAKQAGRKQDYPLPLYNHYAGRGD